MSNAAPQAADLAGILPGVGALEHRELTIVMPVYNEEASLEKCARSWLDTLDASDIDYRLLILDDGSKDATPGSLEQLSQHAAVVGVTKSNEGHGPTILRGYRAAVLTSDWVFQVDSDDEIPASAFGAMWDARDGNDAVFGQRTGRDQSVDRAVITKIARLATRLLFNARATDANVPFRLMRASALAPVLSKLPDDTFAPNVIISGALSRDRDKFAEMPVPHEFRQAGQVSIVGIGALKAAARSFVQTARLARSFR